MIQQVGTQQTVQAALKTATATQRPFEAYVQRIHATQDDIDAHTSTPRIDIGNAQFGDYFTNEDVQRWRTSIDTVDATYCAFLQFVSFTGEQHASDVSNSMSYYDFCYLLEQGDIVNEQNVGFTEEMIQQHNWDFSVMLTETFHTQNAAQNTQQLQIMRAVMDLGIVSRESGLPSPEDIRALVAKKKYKEQQLQLERAFEKKHVVQQLFTSLKEQL